MAAKKPATYADLEALPPQFVGEIVEGELYASPRPAYGHAHAESVLTVIIGGTFGRGGNGPGGWRILVEPELHFGDQVLVPDLAGWREERFPTQVGPSTPYFTVAPDWVCEIISPRTARLDRTKKKSREPEV